jgi:prepilin-type N-terminal cleavage/methylation domain-containing protein
MRPGFTLIELLVVVGIMAMMLSIAAIGIQNVDKGQATVSGLSQAQALMDETRNLAVGRNTRARLCIHAESSEEDRNLRFAVVAYEKLERDSSGNITNRTWTTETRGTYLPSGVYFAPSLTQQAAMEIEGIGAVGTDNNVRFPGDPSKNTRNPTFYYWEFNSEGICKQEDASNPGAAFVLCRGVTGPNASEPRVIGNDVAGFVVWRNGRTSKIRDTSIISTGNNS